MITTPDEAYAIQLAVFEAALEIVQGKRVDYSGTTDAFGNFRSAETVYNVPAWVGAGIRGGDKTKRFAQVGAQGGTGKVDENIYDTLKDELNYAVIKFSLWLEEGHAPELRQALIERGNVIKKVAGD